MRAKVLTSLAILVFCGGLSHAQYPSQPPVNGSQDPLVMIANQLVEISRNVQIMNERLKTAADKTNAPVPTVSDPRQKIILGLQALTSAEQRVINFQAAQFELTQQLTDTRGKLAQTELDL